MAGKIIKGLSCLGGVGALTVGGVYLNDYIQRENVKRSRKDFLKRTDDAAKNLEQPGFAYGHLLFKSDTGRDLVERSWVVEAGDENWSKATQYTKEEMLKYEEEQWKKINDKSRGTISRYIDIDDEKRREIEEKYQDYWEKYYEACLAWNLTRDGSKTFGSGSNPICTVLMSRETYEKKDEYKKYKELKEKGLQMGAGEFYWTIWRRFKDNRKGQIENEDKDGSNASAIFDAWKNENKDLFTNAGIKDLQA